MGRIIPDLSAYDAAGYDDTDREAAAALRAPLLALLLPVPAPDRAAWLAAFAEGLRDSAANGTVADRESPAYAVGYRAALLATEEGYA